MPSVVVHTLHHPSATRKVEIYRRDDGSFGFVEWRYSAEEDAWYPYGRYSMAIVDSLDSAEREARSRVTWLRDLSVGRGLLL